MSSSWFLCSIQEDRSVYLTSVDHLQRRARIPVGGGKRCPRLWQVHPLVRQRHRPASHYRIPSAEAATSRTSPDFASTVRPRIAGTTASSAFEARSDSSPEAWNTAARRTTGVVGRAPRTSEVARWRPPRPASTPSHRRTVARPSTSCCPVPTSLKRLPNDRGSPAKTREDSERRVKTVPAASAGASAC